MKINPEKKQIVFVASELSDLNNLITALPSSVVVVKLDPFEDGLTQIARVLFNLKDLNSIHIVSHGSEGALQLGSTILNAGNIYDYLQQLSTIGSSLNVNGNIFIYGCSVAAGTDGQAFIQALAQLTKSDIAASSNITGSNALGGDWILESATGQINSTGFFQNTTSEEFQGTLSLPGIHIASNSSGIFLGGNFMELGIRTNNEIGKFGAQTAPGGSFTGRTNANGIVIPGIGLVGDADGFGTGSILNVDYFMPGEPEEGFYAGYKVSGVVTTGKNFGSSVINTSSGSTLSAVITGTVGSGTLEVIQTISFGVNDKYFINTVTLTNKSTNAIDNVRFMRSMDPDNTVDKSGSDSYTTVNTIENTFAAGDAYAAVSAKSPVGDSYYVSSGSNQAVILYYSTDSRAKVGMATSGLMPAGVYDNTVYDNASTKGTTGTYDAFISIAFDAGTLAPGASTTFDYYTVLDNGSVSRIINSLTSVVLNRAPVGSVVMSGSFNQGATVTASNNITDSDGLGAITYKWQSSTDAITWSEFATGSSFTLTESQVGKYLRINASYIDGLGTSESVNSSSSSIVVNVNDVPSGSVVINGTIKKGYTVTASNSIADLDGLGGITYKWQSSTDAITWSEFATGSSFTLTESQVGKYLRINASYIDGRGTSESVNSSISSIVVDVNNVPSGSVSINGTIRQGSTVTASNSIADLDGLGGITYKWQSSTDAITWSQFATGSSFTLTESQVGKYLRINASYIDQRGTTESVNSAPSIAVFNVNDVPSGSVSINGTIKKGSTVTASNSIADLDGIGAISYKWQSSSNLIQWADVKTGASLTIADAQVGKYLRVNATYIDGHGTNETVISDVSDLLRSGNHKPVAKPISKAVSIFENASFNFALPAGTFTDVDAGDKITYSSPNLLDGLYINPIAGTIYGKVGFTAANNPQHIITIKATDRSGAFATTQLTLKIVNVPALMGKTSIDTLIAGNGNDRIWGKGGADTLTGGSGADEFNFDASPLLGLSTITDFVPGVDKLRLSLKVFPTLGFVPSNATQTLISASLFETGSSISTATKATTRVFFNQSTSTLYYDADGLGDVAPTPIVKLMGVTTSLNSTDIYIFN